MNNMDPILANLFGNVADNVGNVLSTYMTNKSNKDLTQMQNRFNIEQWEREMRYNSPIEQMKRLMEAGINPAFAYSNGISGNTTTAPTSAQPIPMQAPQVGGFADLSNRISLDKLRGVQEDESKSRIRLNDSTILVNDSTIALQGVEAEHFKKSIEHLGTSIAVNYAKLDELKKKIDGMDLDNQLKAIEVFVQENIKGDRTMEIAWKNSQMAAEVEYLLQQALVGKSLVSLNNSLVSLNKTQEDLNKATEENLEELTRKYGADANAIEFQNNVNQEVRQYIIDSIILEFEQQQLNVDISKLQKELNDYNLRKFKDPIYRWLAGLFGLIGTVLGGNVNYAAGGHNNTSTSTSFVTKVVKR